MARERSFDARRLDVPAFGAGAASLQGDIPQAGFERLSASLPPMPGDRMSSPVHWRVAGEQRRPAGGAAETRLDLQAATTVRLQCQRCLQPMAEALDLDRWFRFVASADEAERLDEESEEDVLVASRQFDLIELVEDELILALPLVPRHETCPQPLPMSAGEEVLDETPAETPFAALAALRRGKG